jgi:hypothetical protein
MREAWKLQKAMLFLKIWEHWTVKNFHFHQCQYLNVNNCDKKAWGSVVVKALRYLSDGTGIDFRWCHLIFQWHISFWPFYGPGIDSASLPPGGKFGRRVGLTSPHSRAVCHGIWEPKPPGTLWATPGLLRDCFTFTVRHASPSNHSTHQPAEITRVTCNNTLLTNHFNVILMINNFSTGIAPPEDGPRRPKHVGAKNTKTKSTNCNILCF